MCRHLAYAGPPLGARGLLLDPPHSLVAQVDEPRCQLPGVTNRDGWGIAWLAGGRADWLLHRSIVALSEDAARHDVLTGITSPAIVAAVRRASPGLALVETGNAPFVAGRWAFSLNGFVGGFADGTSRATLTDALSSARVLAGDTDTEVLLGLVLDRLDVAAPTDPGVVLADVVQLALAAAGERDSRLNLLLTDGRRIWATRWSNSLFHRMLDNGGVVVASEPWDDDPGWVEVPDRSVVEAGAEGVAVSPLA